MYQVFLPNFFIKGIWDGIRTRTGISKPGHCFWYSATSQIFLVAVHFNQLLASAIFRHPYPIVYIFIHYTYHNIIVIVYLYTPFNPWATIRAIFVIPIYAFVFTIWAISIEKNIIPYFDPYNWTVLLPYFPFLLICEWAHEFDDVLWVHFISLL